MIALRAAEVDSPRLDAEVLLAAALGVDRAALVMEADREVPGEAARHFRTLIRRRTVGREPVAYLVGHKGFRHLDLAVDPRVLVPRPETELVVEVAVELAPQGARVVDVGTGSGAIALALKQERPDLEVLAVDASEDALAVARGNAERLGLDVAFLHGDLLGPVDGPVDVVLSNPPYVADSDRAWLQPEIRHEPPQALFSGPTGFEIVQRLVVQAAARGARLLAVEVGAGQAGSVCRFAAAAGYADVEARRDLAGIERVVVARWT
jgi:release factor glutamine methyltransferase